MRPPAVRGAVPPPLPGATRIGDAEEGAAVEAVRRVIRRRRLFRHSGVSSNPLEPSEVARLERAFGERLGTRHALALNSGTSALVAGLVGAGVGPGDEVVVPAYTWVSTATAVMAAGAVPVVAEVDESLTIDPEDAAAKVSERTRALVAVHMRGAPAAMDRLGDLVRRKDLKLLEDAAQAAGASFRGRRLGSIGDAGAFSFHHAKVITSGEGGLLATDDHALHERATMYHDSASPVHAGVAMDDWAPGLNLRMSELQAAVALTQLRRLDELLAAMRARKARLKELLAAPLRARGVSFRTIHDRDGDAGLAMIFFLPNGAETARVVAALEDQNVPASRLYHGGERLPRDYTDLHVYPHWTPVLRRFSYSPDACPRTVELLSRAVHVDVSPDLAADQTEQMAGAIAGAVEKLV